jgi:hypothetical protein
MKKNFLTAGAIMVTAFLLATTVVQAADVTLGGEFWTRYEISERNDFRDHTDADSYIQSRVRLNASVNVNDSTSAFIQLHSNRTWGDTAENAGVGTAPMGLNGTQSVNDATRDVGFHQAYFTLKNFAGLPLDMKAGRQEIILDGHRLFGNTLWTMGAHSHDAIRLNHKHDNITFSYGFIQQNEERATAGTQADAALDNGVAAGDPNDSEDQTTQFLYANFAGVLGGKLSTMYIYKADGCGGTTGSTTCSGGANDIHTIGFRQAGQLFGLDYRGEYYYQFGDAQGIAAAETDGDAAANPNMTNGFNNVGGDVDRDAYMFGVRVGKQFKNVSMKPKLTLWYDYLSGTSDEDGKNDEWKSFNTIYDTGHKFYGLQDVFLGVGNNSCATGTCGLGLQDAAIKAQISPVPGWTLKADYHWLTTAEGVAGSKRRSNTNAGGSVSSELGQELDVTLVNKYNANTKIMMGYSHFAQGEALRTLRGAGYGNDDANWFYTQIHVGF